MASPFVKSNVLASPFKKGISILPEGAAAPFIKDASDISVIGPFYKGNLYWAPFLDDVPNLQAAPLMKGISILQEGAAAPFIKYICIFSNGLAAPFIK